jgi:hypothetical protein
MTMKNLLKFSTALLPLLTMGAALLSAQTLTPNTTLSAAQSATATSICLTATTGVLNQTGVYVDQELELVQISNNGTVPAGPACVPVSRANRGAGSGPVAHNSAAPAFLAYTPASSLVPGANGFELRSKAIPAGPCVRANEPYLPKIFPDAGVMLDCNQSTVTTNGVWVNYNNGNTQNETQTAVVALTTNGALTVTSGNYVITKAGVLADTLGAPTAGIQDGTLIVLTSSTANAHTLTATGLLQTGTASVNVATFAAQAGAGLVLQAFNGKWIVISSVGITFS